MPSERALKEGDIVSLDFGVLNDGYYGDAAITVPVGTVTAAARKLLKVTEEALYDGIAAGQGGQSPRRHLRGRPGPCRGRRILRGPRSCGARHRQEPPRGPAGPQLRIGRTGIELKPGMVLAIEPMVNEGSYRVEILPRRLDGGDRRREAVGPFRALRGDYGKRAGRS
ncbi:MAG: M24 family metallopeptidase [Desulfobacterales bacterium]|nr:M24 family metallopeptidase [Desulfobacterales bacterium]